jgi:hypothetical protein
MKPKLSEVLFDGFVAFCVLTASFIVAMSFLKWLGGI